jgi:hypothetical protein
MLNELDAELTRRKLNTRIVFIAYNDTIRAPEVEVIKNPKRFTCLFAPISRDFSKSMKKSEKPIVIPPYQINNNELPTDFETVFAHFENWRKMWHGSNISYDYHFWRHQYYDLGGIQHSKVISGDIKFYSENKVHGVIEDGSQRSFFPTGLSFYTYARTLYDNTLSFDEIAEEYFSCAFGENWRKFYDYLDRLGKAFDYEYLEGRKSGDPERSQYFAPEHVKNLLKAKEITSEGRELIKEHYNSDYRIRTASVRLLEKHANYADLLADALIPKTQGKDDEADALFAKMAEEFGKEEAAIQNCYDHGLAFTSLKSIFKTRTRDMGPIIY